MMPVAISKSDFLADQQGRRFKNVVSDPRINFNDWLDFFNDPERQKIMEYAESRFHTAALGGVITELERHPAFAGFLAGYDAHTTLRGLQAIGVIVRMVMEGNGWQTTGKKGALGR